MQISQKKALQTAPDDALLLRSKLMKALQKDRKRKKSEKSEKKL